MQAVGNAAWLCCCSESANFGVHVILVEMRYSTEERLFVVKLCIKSELNGRIRMTWVRQRFLEHYHKPGPSENAIRKLVNKHNETGSVLNDQKGKSGRSRSARTEINH